MPVTVQRLAESGDYDAVVCLGCLIKGDTMHFEYIAESVTHALAQVALQSGIPIALRRADHAHRRPGRRTGAPGAGNKGAEAARAAVEMASLFRPPRCGARRMKARASSKAEGAEPGATRHRAREAALQMLYHWEVGGVGMAEVLRTWPALSEDAGRLPEPCRRSPRGWRTAPRRRSRPSIR